MASPPPPSPGLSKKPHSQFPVQPSRIQQIPSKSHSNSICKTLTVLLLLLLIPFFPSQPPGFITQTIFTQFWEIIHLLFVGIAVSYGLFGRKIENLEISRNDDSNPYLSEISHLSSIFEDRFGNICCGPDELEQDVIQSYYANCQCFGDHFLGKNRCVVHGGSSSSSSKITSFRGRENFSDSDLKNVNQSWSSKCLQSESLVVVSNGGNFDFKPLNLPVRSLRSNVVDIDKPDFQTRHEYDPSPKFDVKIKKIRGVVPTILENKFDDHDGSSSIHWRPKSGSMEIREELKSDTKPRVQCIGDFDFERINYRSNEGSEISSSGELEIPKVEDAEGEEVISVSRPKIAPLSDEVLFSGSNARSFSVGDSFEGDRVGKGKQPMESSAVAKALSKAKSVRTKKPSRYVTTQKERCSSRIDGKLEDLDANRGKEEEPEKPLVNHKNDEVDRRFLMPKPKPSLPGFFKEETEEIVEQNVIEEREEDRGGEINESCDEDDAKTNVDYDLGSEVDRKADEFIAKFREQIRLQKDSSTEKSFA